MKNSQFIVLTQSGGEGGTGVNNGISFVGMEETPNMVVLLFRFLPPIIIKSSHTLLKIFLTDFF